jgi:ABC-2 type transport system permease protein
MDWRKVWVIARQDYLTNLRRAGFIIMTLSVPLIGLVLLLGSILFSGQAGAVEAMLEQQFDVGGGTIGIVDRSGYFTPILPAYRDMFIPYESEEAAQAALAARSVTAVIVIDRDYIETGRVVVMTTGSGFGAAVVEDSSSVRRFFVAHLLEGEVDPALRDRAADPFTVESVVVSGRGEQGGILFTFIIPYFLSIFLLMTIFTSSGYLLQSVAEEKESRVIEIVVSSVRPLELMAGKVLGLGALGLTQVLVWLLSTWALSGSAGAILAVGGITAIPLRVLVLGVVYYLLGYTLYAILMAGVGALGTTMRESQQLAGIFSLFAAIPYMLASFVMFNPNALLMRVFSFFPLTAPTMMMLRLPLAEVPWVDVVGSIALLLLSIPAALWFGSKLFEVGLLIYGKRPALREIWAILRSGSRPPGRHRGTNRSPQGGNDE